MTGARLFGKLPAHGDFVARGLAAPDRAMLDAWLSQEMVLAQAAHTDAFEDSYGRAPPWRFCGEGMAGVLVASIDAVGRRFPLWLAADGGVGTAEQVEALVYGAFEQGWDADRIILEAEALAADASEQSVSEPRWWTLGGIGFAPAERAGLRPEGLLVAMLTMEVA